jgi:hypothetical protein
MDCLCQPQIPPVALVGSVLGASAPELVVEILNRFGIDVLSLIDVELFDSFRTPEFHGNLVLGDIRSERIGCAGLSHIILLKSALSFAREQPVDR